MVKVRIAVAPEESLIVMLPLKDPATVGVPVKLMVLPFSTGVRPGGMLVVLKILWAGVPLLIVMVPEKPALTCVHAVVVKALIVGAELMAIVN